MKSVDEPRKLENLFFYSSAVVLSLTALAKLYSATGDAKILMVEDQLLHLGYRPLMIFAALVEAAVAAYLFGSNLSLIRAVALLWLSANFMAYHFGNYVLGFKNCPCLGSLSAKLSLPSGVAENLLRAFILYWFVGSFYLVWRAWAEAQTLKMDQIYASQLEGKVP